MSTDTEESPGDRPPEAPRDAETDSERSVAVIFTTIESTLSALKEAAVLAARRNATITLIVPQFVSSTGRNARRSQSPYRSQRRFRVLAGQRSVETRVRICCCRDSEIVPKPALDPHSV